MHYGLTYIILGSIIMEKRKRRRREGDKQAALVVRKSEPISNREDASSCEWFRARREYSVRSRAAEHTRWQQFPRADFPCAENNF